MVFRPFLLHNRVAFHPLIFIETLPMKKLLNRFEAR